jgi:uncharacterized membrane protein YcaP (DUF421 family)
MGSLFEVHWGEVFRFGVSPLEIVVRGTLMYLILFALLRIILKREAGTVGLTDLLVVVLIADAAQNGMAGEYNSLSDGIVLVGTIIFWSYALDWLAFHFPAVERIIKPEPLPLIRDGRLLHENMRQELITEAELRSQLREQGHEDPDQIKVANMESDGRISAIAKENDQSDGQSAPERRGV